MEIQGKADTEKIIFINGDEGIVSIEEAVNVPDEAHLLTQQLTEHYSVDTSEREKVRVSVVSTGEGAKHTKIGCLNFSWYNKKREWASYKQAGRGGIGTVFADKKLKALVCRSPRANAKINNPAGPEGKMRVKNITLKLSQMIHNKMK